MSIQSIINSIQSLKLSSVAKNLNLKTIKQSLSKLSADIERSPTICSLIDIVSYICFLNAIHPVIADYLRFPILGVSAYNFILLGGIAIMVGITLSTGKLELSRMKDPLKDLKVHHPQINRDLKVQFSYDAKELVANAGGIQELSPDVLLLILQSDLKQSLKISCKAETHRIHVNIIPAQIGHGGKPIVDERKRNRRSIITLIVSIIGFLIKVIVTL